MRATCAATMIMAPNALSNKNHESLWLPGLALPAAIIFSLIVGIILTGMLARSPLDNEIQLQRAGQMLAESIARPGLESVIYQLRQTTIDADDGTLYVDDDTWVAITDDSDAETDATTCGIVANGSAGSDADAEDEALQLAGTYYFSGDSAASYASGTAVADLPAALKALTLPTQTLSTIDDGFTLEAWLWLSENKTTSFDFSGQRIFDIGNKTSSDASNVFNQNISLFVNGEGRLQFFMAPPSDDSAAADTSDDYYTLSQDTPLPLQTWVHVSASVSRDSITLKSYCDSDSEAIGTEDEWVDSTNTERTGSVTNSCGSYPTVSVTDVEPPVSNTSKRLCDVTSNSSDATCATDGWTNDIEAADVKLLSAYVGKSNRSQDPYLEGFLHNVKVWEQALTVEEIESGIENDLGSSTTVEDSIMASPRFSVQNNSYVIRYFTSLDSSSQANQYRVTACVWANEKKMRSLGHLSSQMSYANDTWTVNSLIFD